MTFKNSSFKLYRQLRYALLLCLLILSLFQKHNEASANVIFTKEIMISEEFAEDYSIIESGIKQWNTMTNGFIVPVVKRWNGKSVAYNSECKASTIYVSPTSHDSIKHLDGSKKSYMLGLTLKSQKCQPVIIYIVKDKIYSKSMLKHVSAHEFGHAIGIEHITDSVRAVMSPFYNKSSKCLTRLDATEFCKVYNCSIKNFKYCI